MKRLIAGVLLTLSLAALCACAQRAPASDVPAEDTPLLGGWQTAEDPALSPREEEIFREAVSGADLPRLEPEKLLATQVVAGINYRFAARDENGQEYTLTVWHTPEGKNLLTRLTDAQGKDLPVPAVSR